MDFFMNPSVVELYETIKKELDELIQNKVSRLVCTLTIECKI